MNKIFRLQFYLKIDAYINRACVIYSVFICVLPYTLITECRFTPVKGTRISPFCENTYGVSFNEGERT